MSIVRTARSDVRVKGRNVLLSVVTFHRGQEGRNAYIRLATYKTGRVQGLPLGRIDIIPLQEKFATTSIAGVVADEAGLKCDEPAGNAFLPSGRISQQLTCGSCALSGKHGTTEPRSGSAMNVCWPPVRSAPGPVTLLGTTFQSTYTRPGIMIGQIRRLSIHVNHSLLGSRLL
jgi:hypothetical protein